MDTNTRIGIGVGIVAVTGAVVGAALSPGLRRRRGAAATPRYDGAHLTSRPVPRSVSAMTAAPVDVASAGSLVDPVGD